jgi:hypothetical protein
MAKGEGLFWVASADKAAAQIFNAIQLKNRCLYYAPVEINCYAAKGYSRQHL